MKEQENTNQTVPEAGVPEEELKVQETELTQACQVWAGAGAEVGAWVEVGAEEEAGAGAEVEARSVVPEQQTQVQEIEGKAACQVWATAEVGAGVKVKAGAEVEAGAKVRAGSQTGAEVLKVGAAVQEAAGAGV